MEIWQLFGGLIITLWIEIQSRLFYTSCGN